MVEVKARDMSEVEDALRLSAKELKVVVLCNRDRHICPQVYEAVERLIKGNEAVVNECVSIFNVTDVNKKGFKDAPAILYYVNDELLAKIALSRGNVSIISNILADSLNIILSVTKCREKFQKGR